MADKMMLLWFHMLLGTLWTMPELSLGISYNLQAETSKSFACYSALFKNSLEVPPVIKLFLDDKSLDVVCHLFSKQETDDKKSRRKNLVLYTSAGLAPSIEIFNSSYSRVFYFKMILDENQFTWSLEIPRSKIAHNTNIAPTEQWYVKFSMHHGLNMFTTEGTLLDFVREPILQWFTNDANNVSTILPNVINITVTKSPCASDVAILGLILDDKVSGMYLAVTWSAFMTQDTTWSNLTENICVTLDYDCADLSLLNVILTNTRLVFLTTLGLFISEDLRYGKFYNLKFTKPNFCGFERDDYFRAKIWYNIQCLANQENYEVDYISISFNKDKTLSQESTCFYSNDPFMEWHSCLPHRTQAEKLLSRRVVSFLVDYQQNTGIGVLTQQGRTFVSVNKLINHKLHKKRKFPEFWFPDAKFKAFGMLFHPNSHFLYVYGNQVWLSEDGGNTFQPLIKLVNETVVKTDTCVYTQAIIFVTDKGSVFYTKAGLYRYARITSVQESIFNLNFDHLGILNLVMLDEDNEDYLTADVMDVDTLLQEDDLAFGGPLSPQYITEEQVLFFSHEPSAPHSDRLQPRFHEQHVGKALEYKMGGSGVINKVFQHKYPPHFLSSIAVDVLKRFPIETSASSPCLLNTLTILPPDAGTTAFKLQLSPSGTQIFQASDVEKTIMIPGSSSFLIINVTSDLTALGEATMPQLVILNNPFQSGNWFMYDFGTRNGQKWKVIVDKCRYTIEQFDDLPVHAIKYLDPGSTLNFSFRVTPVNLAYNVFHMDLMTVVVGKPNLLDVNTEDYWDDTDSYSLKIRVQSKFFEQGKTSIAVMVSQASLACDVTTLILTLKNSCSYLKVMHYILPVQLSPSDWLLEMANTSKYLKNLPAAVQTRNVQDLIDPAECSSPFFQTSRAIQVFQTWKGTTLLPTHPMYRDPPVNYRPPSRLGISVPLTENFYNADPGKPRMRDHFLGSKSSGIYKQCANKTSRDQCGCTENMKLSFFVAFSDCKEKAIRMKYPIIKLPISFTVENEDGPVNLSSPYFVTITEVNNRTNWEISGTNVTSSMLKMRNYLEPRLKKALYNPDGLTLSIYGSELFHFRVTTIPGISFCSLFDEFQIYVDDAPLAFPGDYLIGTLTAVFIGFIIFVAFILQAYDIQVWSILKQTLKQTRKVSPKVSQSSVSTTSTAANGQ